MNDNQILARMLVNAFLEDYSNLTEKIKSHPQDDEVIRCGIELLKEEIQETEELSMYAMYSVLWIAFYLGAGTGLEIYDTIMKGEKNDQSRQL